ncbi:hypothetical protein SAY87_031828 [Trapa incisa]|uniref:J domain-containing protein n=1 Tax=Trapa incisa TaxID=236973 RepID=A0AAN7KQ29_9MYRT|nr:hypothetical protein SAY87_031828 [Trapa incisa]
MRGWAKMRIHLTVSLLFVCSLCLVSLEAKKLDPYKALGVDKDASQREIQKAFHKLSLQYHPDKNKNKGAQEKFSEINNAYEILSDEEKRKNYDLYGDEKGNPGFDPGHTGGGGGGGGYTYFTHGGPGFTFMPGHWQTMGGSGGFKSFSYSFGGSDPLDSFDLGDVFSGFFQGGQSAGFKSSGQSTGFKSSGQYAGFKSSAGSQFGSRSSTKSSIRTVNSQVFKSEITNGGMIWLLLFKTPGLKDNEYYESLIEEVASSLEGVLKVGVMNCDSEPSLCKELGTYPRKSPRMFVHTYNIVRKSGYVVEYHGDLVKKDLKVFCQEHLPRFSKRINLKGADFDPDYGNGLPSVLLLSTKKETPILWRALSGLCHKRFNFYDTQVHDISELAVNKLGVNSLPAIVGWLKNGEKHVLRTGISVKDMKSAFSDLNVLLDDLEKKNKKVASSQARKAATYRESRHVPLLTASNFDTVCGEDAPVCIIGAFRSLKERQTLESILSTVSRKSLSRQLASGSAISYALVDAGEHPAFLRAFEKSGFKSSNKLLVAYKPRKGKFAAYTDEITQGDVEWFIGSVLNGDVEFSKSRQKPKLS